MRCDVQAEAVTPSVSCETFGAFAVQHHRFCDQRSTGACEVRRSGLVAGG
jgi:hypothetical protein